MMRYDGWLGVLCEAARAGKMNEMSSIKTYMLKTLRERDGDVDVDAKGVDSFNTPREISSKD